MNTFDTYSPLTMWRYGIVKKHLLRMEGVVITAVLFIEDLINDSPHIAKVHVHLTNRPQDDDERERRIRSSLCGFDISDRYVRVKTANTTNHDISCTILDIDIQRQKEPERVIKPEMCRPGRIVVWTLPIEIAYLRSLKKSQIITQNPSTEIPMFPLTSAPVSDSTLLATIIGFDVPSHTVSLLWHEVEPLVKWSDRITVHRLEAFSNPSIDFIDGC